VTGTPGAPTPFTTAAEADVFEAWFGDLFRVIAEISPGSLEELSEMTGRAKSNMSRTLKTMAGYGLVRMERGQGRKLAPKGVHDRVALELPLVEPMAISGSCND
jgi:predicted transcriptional regulator